MIQILITKTDYQPATLNIIEGENITPTEAAFLYAPANAVCNEELEASYTQPEAEAHDPRHHGALP